MCTIMCENYGICVASEQKPTVLCCDVAEDLQMNEIDILEHCKFATRSDMQTSSVNAGLGLDKSRK